METKDKGFINTKHFIWIVPMILVIGFILGYVSGLNIPKEITFGVEPKTLEALNKISDNTLELSKINANCTENPQKQELNVSNYPTCDFDTIDMTKYYCCKGQYKQDLSNSIDWICNEELWLKDRS
jgi:hypothetical protein